MTCRPISALTKGATADAVVEWLGEAEFVIGPSFHPGTLSADYINPVTNSLSFDATDINSLDASLSVAFDLLGGCVYEEGRRQAWRLMHGMPRQSVQDSRWHLLAAHQHLDPKAGYNDEHALRDGGSPTILASAHAALSGLRHLPVK